MATYRGQLWLVPDVTNEISVEIDIDDERIRVTSRDLVIGDWALADVELNRRDHNIFMLVEGEQLIISSPDSGFGLALIGEELDESDEGYVPYEPTHRGRHLRHQKKRKGVLRQLFSRS